MGVVLSVKGEAVEGRNMGMTVHLIDLTPYILRCFNTFHSVLSLECHLCCLALSNCPDPFLSSDPKGKFSFYELL